MAICRLTPEKVQVSYVNTDKITEIIAKIDDLKQSITDTIDQLIDLKDGVREAIESLQSPSREIMELRYLECKTWEDIAKTLCYSISHVYALHRKAIAKTLSYNHSKK